jgi:D-3-phosphoglycerate dehydrogenase
MKVIYTNITGSHAPDIAGYKKYMPDDYEIEECIQDPADPEAFIASIADADVILNTYANYGPAEIDALKHCRGISQTMAAFSTVDVDYAAKAGLAVSNVHEYCTAEVSDHAIMFILALNKGLMTLQNSVQQDKEWQWAVAAPLIRKVEGQTLGVAGLGKIGQAAARKAQALGMNVIAYDPYLPPSVAESMDVKLVEIEQLLEESDAITVHMNLTSENQAFFDLDKFSKMKKKPVIINVARGGVINEEDLVKALDLGYVRGAGLDVLESETPDLTKSPLVGRPNVILTPHSAFFSPDSIEALVRVSATNAVALAEGRYKDVFKVVNGVGV